ncbi:MAG: glycosyltransferase family 4 protein [candidate division WOR-3 bacterium]
MKQKILILAPYVPIYSSGGGGAVIYNYIKTLSQSYTVDVICFSTRRPNDLTQLQMVCNKLEVVPLNKINAIFNCVYNLFSHNPFRLAYVSSVKMREQVRYAMERESYDLIFANHERMAPYAMLFKDTRRIIDLHDLVSLRHKQLLSIERNPIKWLINFVESYRMRQFEKMIPNYFDIVLLGNSWEVCLLREKRRTENIMIAPRGIEVESFNKHIEAIPNTIIFLGTLNYQPNEDACLYFSKKILPLILKSIPAVKFYIVGNKPTKAILKLAKNKNIIVTGYVPDTLEYLKKAAVMVCPLRVGTGIRIKILEAMAAGRPVVSTTIGYLGIEATNMQNIVIADKPQDFADLTIRLLRDIDFYKKIAEGGRELVLKKYDINKNLQSLNRIIETING